MSKRLYHFIRPSIVPQTDIHGRKDEDVDGHKWTVERTGRRTAGRRRRLCSFWSVTDLFFVFCEYLANFSNSLLTSSPIKRPTPSTERTTGNLLPLTIWSDYIHTTTQL